MKSIGHRRMKRFVYNILAILLLVCFFTNTVLAATGQIVTDSITKSVDSFSDKIPYAKDGLQGVLGKNGQSIPRVVSGSYIEGRSKEVTNFSVNAGSDLPRETWLYNKEGYTGILNLVDYSNNRYEEDLGYYEEETETKFFHKTHDNICTDYYSASGVKIRSEYSWDGTNDHPTLYIEEDGYKGYLDKVDSEKVGEDKRTNNPDGSYKIVTTWRGIYEKTLSKIVRTWISNKVMMDHYTGYYSGTVKEADQDTRVWEYTQNYKGSAVPIDVKELNLGNPPNSECVGEPVNIVTGNFYATVLDLSIPDRGIPLEISRYYNSLDSREGVMGKSWRFSYDSTLSADASTGNVKVIYPDGHTVIFTPKSGGGYDAPETVFDVLTANAGGTYTLTLQSKLIYDYDTNGRLTAISDTNGNTVSLQYGSDGYLNTVTGAGGKVLSFDFENGKLKTITDPAGRTIVYSYTSGNLAQVKGVGGGTILYEYAASGLKSITDQNGRKYVRNEYDGFGRVEKQYDEDGNETQFIYDDANLENTCIFTSTQSITKYKYNEKLHITKKTFADGTYEEYTYDQWGNRDSIRNRNGNTTAYTFDARGNKLSEQAPAPFHYLTTYSYDASDNLLQANTPGGARTDFEYDENSNLTKTTVKLSDTASASTVVDYDIFGRITSITDAENNVTTLKYAADDNPVKITDPEGNSVEYGYDSVGRKTSITTYLGTTVLAYNNNDKIEKITDPAGNITRMKYDSLGNLIKLIKPQQYNNATDDGSGYTYTYDAMDRLLHQIDPLGDVAAVKYDQLGKKIKDINPNYYNAALDDGEGTGYEYDGDGRIIAVINPSGQKSRLVYDPVGNRTKIIDANNYNEASDSGAGVQFTYDSMNRLVETRDTSGRVTSRLVYDADNRVVKAIDAKGYLSGTNDSSRYGTENKYNLAGWLLEKRAPVKLENNTVSYQVTKYTYDLTGKMLEQKTSPEYATIGGEPSVWNSITYTYYKNGKVKSISDSLGSNMEYTYDDLGNTTGEKSKVNADKDSVVNYHYNSAGLIDRMWRKIDGDDLQNADGGTVNAETLFEYDKNGNIVKVTRPEGYVTTFEYDAADRLIAKHEEVQEDSMQLKSTSANIVFPNSNIYPGQQYDCKVEIHPDSVVKGVSMEIDYDARAYEFMGFAPGINGVLIDGGTGGKVRIRANGINIGTDTVIATISLRLKTGVSGDGYITVNPSATYTADDGSVYKFSELAGKTMKIKAPDVNGDGRVEADDFTQISLKSGIGIQNPGYDEKYDLNGDGIIDNKDLDYISTYLFNDTPLSNLDQVKYYERTTNGVCKVTSSTVIRTTAYEYDKAGNIIKETDCNGNHISYEYDMNNRLVSVTDKSGAKSRVFYDEVGNRIKEVLPENYNSQTGNGPGTSYIYDAMNRLVEVKDASGTTVQRRVYDANGLLTKLIDAEGYLSGANDSTRYGIEYTYDIGNRIETITSPEAKADGKVSESYDYDAMGYVLSYTDGNDNTTAYERDMWGKITEVVDAKNVSTAYTYDFAGNLASSTDGNDHTTAYEYNSLNKLASITDPAGKTISYKYDKEGRVAEEHNRIGQTIVYVYNSDDNLTLKGVSGKEDRDQYLYDRDGNMFASANTWGIDEYEYDADDLLISRVRNGKPYISYEYNGNKEVTRVTDGSGASTSYTYDVTGRMKTVSNSSSLLATYNYNPDSTISSVNYSTGVNAAYTYDLDKNIIALVNKNSQGSAIGSYSYTYDDNGNQLTKVENGETTAYTYDELNRLKTVDYAGVGLETYTYDNAGNRLSKVLGTDSTTYTYDSLNRLTQSTNNGVKSTYTYDNNGNLTGLTKGSSNTIYTYDGLNRLTETVMPNGQWMDNAYDAFGLRTATTENGTRYEYTLDRGNVIAENAGEANAARYIRGISLIARESKTGELAWYLHNAHGDVTSLVDGSGNVLNSYTYDAFGNTMTYAETVANRFMYAGEQFDKVTGEYYLRARYYDPYIGRFVIEDTYRGDLESPLSMNLYVYCANNPVNFIDPTGHHNKCIDTAADSGGLGGGLAIGGFEVAEQELAALMQAIGRGLAKAAVKALIRATVRNASEEVVDAIYKHLTEGASKGNGMLGQNGTQVTSKTVWQNGKTERIDVENPNPGQRPGDIHYHDANNTKYRFDPSTQKFYDEVGNLAPNKVQDLLKDKKFQENIDKALNILGENPIYKK